MKAKKNIKSFLREEDGKAIKKSLLISSLGLIVGFGLTSSTSADWHSSVNSHTSGTGTNNHSSTHSNHSNHSSY